MKLFCSLFSILFLLSTTPKIYAKKEINIEKHYKVESTFSGNTSGEDSFHLFIAKNTSSKAYDIIPYLYSNEQINKLQPIEFDKEPSVLSFHNNEGTLSLITKAKEGKSEKIRVLDIDLVTGNTKRSDGFSMDDFKAVIREKDKSILIFADKNSITLIDAQNAESTQEIKINPDQNAKEFFKELSSANVDAINTNEFVQNGSINEFKAYFENGKLTITQDVEKEGKTKVLQLPITNNSNVNAEVNELSSSAISGKTKKSTSYLSDDKLYQLKLNKEEAKLDVFNLETQTNSLIDLLDTSFQNAASQDSSIDRYLKNATKGSNAPTVTINKAKEGKLKVRFDYVNKKLYNYNYNWWWHHQWMMQQMMWQQQMHMRAAGFGPMPIENIYFEKDEQNYFEIGIDTNGNLIKPEELNTIYKDIDKKAYVKKLDENKKLKHSSTVFMDKTFRYLAYDKSTKSFKIFDEALDD